MSLGNPKVSVIMPAFNAGMFISEAIESIKNQTLQEWELIVVDDGSTDNTTELVNSFITDDLRIKLETISHAGVANAANIGHQLAKGEFHARMDSDDVSLPDRLEKQVRFLEQYPEVGVVSGQVEMIHRSARSEGLQSYVEWANSLHSFQDISLSRFIDAPVVNPTACFRSHLIEDLGGYEQGDFPEDYELWLRWLGEGVIINSIDEKVLKWRDHDQKLTRSDDRYRESVMWETKGRYFSEWYLKNIDRDRELIIWGSGRKSRSRLKYIEAVTSKCPIAAFIDVDPKKIGQKINDIPVFSPDHLVENNEGFVIGMVGSRGARRLIQQSLFGSGRVMGKDFIFVA